ncbi:MAG: hypothetical protein D6744_10490, partial [Planctomycetota bacterium]
CGSPVAAVAQHSTETDQSLARYVPADVGIFVEVRRAEDLLTALLEPQLWSTMAEFAGQPSSPRDVKRWRDQVQATVRMAPDEAIRVLFAGGVAFVGEGVGRSHDAVVLCRPDAEHPPQTLIKRWNAQRIGEPRQPPTYTLYRNIGVATREGILCFGDLIPPQGMYRHVLQSLAAPGKNTLAANPTYRALLARVPPRPDGVFFAAFEPQPASTQPTARRMELPGLFARSAHILLALHREGPLLHFSAVGDAPTAPASQPAAPPHSIDIRRLPAQCLVAWKGNVDYPALLSSIRNLPERNVLRTAADLLAPLHTLERLLAALAPSTCLSVGLVRPGDPAASDPPFPAAALLIATRDADVVDADLSAAIESVLTVYNFACLRAGLLPLPPVRRVTIGETEARVADFTRLLENASAGGVGELHLAWAVHDEVLILATHEDWLRRIIQSREGRTADLSRVVALSRVPIAERSENALVVQLAAIADAGSQWLAHLKATSPEVLTEDFWRDRQPGGGGVRLGIDVEQDRENQRLRLRSVIPNLPADGRLRPGDFIVGFDNQRFSTDEPIREIRRALRNRPHARWVVLLVERDGVILPIRIPVPFVDPVQGLRRIVALGNVARCVIYHDDPQDPSGARGFLTVELRTSGE